jgi:O-antigen/teichoic acid export membrane protein/glycosyltransferase involved in cell wall biosynthesis
VTLTTDESAVREAVAAASPRPLKAEDAGAGSVAQHSALLAISAGVVGVVSYACTLLMAHLLPAADYSRYSAAVTLIGIVGIVANALVPLPLANVVRRFARRSDERHDGMTFAVLVSLIAGAGSAVVTGGITAAFAPAPVAIAAALAALVLFAVAPALGWLQGELRFVRYAVVSILEVAVRLVFSVLAIAVGWGTPSALLGFVVGAMVLLCGPGALGRDLAWRPGVLRERARWAETGDIALTQFVVSALVGADVVLLALVGDGSTADAGYQALSTLAKGPVYVAAGTVLVVFPLLRSIGARVDEILDAALRSFGRLALLAACVLATVPAGLTLLVLPARYADSLVLVPWLAAAGTGYAAVTVLTTVLLALRAYRRSQLALLAATLLMAAGFAAGWQLGGTYGLAIGSAAGALAATAVLTAIAAPYLPKGIGRAAAVGAAGCAVLLAALLLARPYPLLWLTVAAVAGVVTLLSGRRTGHQDAKDPVATPVDPPVDTATGTPGLRILYLATAGPSGKSAADHPLHRRIARAHAVTVLAPRAPGRSDHISDDVLYRHVGGASRRRLARALGFLRAVPAAVRRYDPDLVVTDLETLGSLAALLVRARPTVGVAPPSESLGRARRASIAVRLAAHRHARVVARPDQLAQLPGSARGRVAPDPDEREHRAARDTRPRLGSHVLYVADGDRQETDVLLAAWALAAHRIDGDLVVCAGSSGAVDAAVEAAERLGIAARVRALTSATGLHRLERIAAARVVVVGTASGNAVALALDALATGTPVVAFDEPALRPIVTPDCGVLVRRLDVDALATALTDVYTAEDRITAWAGRARQAASDRFCDLVASHRQEVYRAAVTHAPAPSSTRRDRRASRSDPPVVHDVPVLSTDSSVASPAEDAPDARAGTRSLRGRTLLAAAGIGLLAMVVRAIGLLRANDLFIDELTYARFAEQIAHGHLPNEDGAPFFLHPPGSIAINGFVVRLLALSGSPMDLAYDLRWVNAVLGSLVVVLSFLIVRRVVNTPAAVAAALILALDPFVLRNDSKVMIETPATLVLLAGWLVLLTCMNRPSGTPGRRRELLAGLVLGVALVTKDMTVVPALVAVLVATVWRRTVPLRTAGRVLVAAVIPYLTYLVVLSVAGLLPQWATAKTSGVLRMVGIEQTTGFNAVSGVSLSERLVDELPRFGTSYLLLALCVPAGIIAAYSRDRARRFVGVVAICTGLLGAYAVAAGAAEEQFGYYVLVASVLAIFVAVAEVVQRRPTLRRTAAIAGVVFVGLTGVLGIAARFVVDDGYVQARTWLSENVPDGSEVGVTGVTAEFAFPQFDVSPSLVTLQDNGDSYVLTASRPLEQGYGYAAPELLDWLDENARPVFDTAGPTNGHVTVWQLDRSVLEKAVESGTVIPPVTGAHS